MYRHVFWDLGGTLVDTYPQLDEAFVGVVRAHGGEVSLDQVAKLTRRSTGAAVAELSRGFGIDGAEFERANRELKALWRQNPAPVMPGARELLADIAAAGGLNLVVTHRDRASALSLVEGLGLGVDDLVSTSDGHPRKPDPAMYRVLLERHGLAAADCLAVGDRPIDAEAAHAAGIEAAMLESAAAPVDDDAEHSVDTLDGLRVLLGLG
ncbi:HAD-IA family hydrolase [Propionibacteriaceae bacterium G57]|uniref:HAD-IA family hydrolase n=1 Tax=Aestuariimicrobium sp. G57 TaxID=3418485 RepID=UPI003DA79B07